MFKKVKNFLINKKSMYFLLSYSIIILIATITSYIIQNHNIGLFTSILLYVNYCIIIMFIIATLVINIYLKRKEKLFEFKNSKCIKTICRVDRTLTIFIDYYYCNYCIGTIRKDFNFDTDYNISYIKNIFKHDKNHLTKDMLSFYNDIKAYNRLTKIKTII